MGCWRFIVQLITIFDRLRVATTIMTVLAASRLRRKWPEMPRSFVVPGGKAGLIPPSLLWW
jgi:hypothetical protein